MKNMSLQDIQMMSLDILKDVHKFCIENNIRYTLQGGTLLGAIRHNGFIPWDDDIDIAMPRPDYNRFIREYSSTNGYVAVSREMPNSNDVLIAFCRVCDIHKTIVNTGHAPWSGRQTGIWIDVFPLDSVEDDYAICLNRIKKMAVLWRMITIKRYRNLPISQNVTFGDYCKWFGRKILSPFISYRFLDEYINQCNMIGWEETSYYSNLSFLGYGIKERHHKRVIKDIILHPFEDTEFCIIKGYDEALTEKYGNYMALPPEKDRVVRHGFNSYYWR